MRSREQGAEALSPFPEVRRLSEAVSPSEDLQPASVTVLHSPRRPVATILLVLAVVIYACMAFVWPLLSAHRLDFAINYSAATLVRTNTGDIYDQNDLQRIHEQRIGPAPDYDQLYKGTFTSYVNPPTTAILLVPLSFLPFSSAAVLFLVLSNGLFLGSVFLLLRLLHTPLRSHAANLVLRCVLPFFPLFVSFFLGQMDAIVIASLTLALYAALEQRDVRAGAWITAAAAFKVSPLLVLGFFVARRRWSALIGFAAVTVFGSAGTLLAVGPTRVYEFATRILPVVGKGSAYFENQSLLGMIYRFAMPRDAVLSLDGMGDYPRLRLVWMASAVVLVAVTFELVRRARLEGRAIIAVAFGAFIVAGLLTGAITWDHYTTWALLPLGALIIDWDETHWIGSGVFWSVLLTAWCLLLFPDVLQVVLYDAVGPAASSLGTYGLLCMLGLSWWRLGGTIRIARPAAQP
jgi:hypothetical protein